MSRLREARGTEKFDPPAPPRPNLSYIFFLLYSFFYMAKTAIMFLFGVKRHHTTTTAICTPTSTVTSLESLNLRRRRTTHLTMYTVVCIPNGQLIER